MVGQVESPDDCPQVIAILLALRPQEVGMCLAGDQVQGVRVLFDDRRHCLHHELESLSRIHEAEGGDYGPALEAQPRLESNSAMRLDRRHPVWDDLGLRP